MFVNRCSEAKVEDRSDRRHAQSKPPPAIRVNVLRFLAQHPALQRSEDFVCALNFGARLRGCRGLRTGCEARRREHLCGSVGEVKRDGGRAVELIEG